MRHLVFLLLICSCTKAVELKSNFEVEPRGKPSPPSGPITFSGYTWNVKHSGTSQWGPGPNYWSRSNVWLDANNHLHLKITTSKRKWYCAEVQTTQSFGYGTWRWTVQGPLAQLDPNMVLGLFNYSGNDGFDEMDVEFAKWGNASNNLLNYTVWPAAAGYANCHNTFPFNPETTVTTHEFVRTASSVSFTSYNGPLPDSQKILTSYTCNNPPWSISTRSMPAFINLWLFQGRTPLNNTGVELVIQKFEYLPL